MREDEEWPYQPQARVGPTGRLRGAVIGGETPSPVQDKHSRMWAGIWFPHPVASVCRARKRSPQSQLAGRASPAGGDVIQLLRRGSICVRASLR